MRMGRLLKLKSYDGVLSDLESKSNNLVNHPIIQWEESPMEGFALAPLPILIGLSNRLYFAADHRKQPL